MDIRRITDAYSVAPQIAAGDMAALAALGFTTVICNRPDHEVPPDFGANALRAAAEAAGLTFVENPIAGGAMTLEAVEAQRAALDASAGPTLAYCASGTRSAVVWAFARAGSLDTRRILEATEAAGYPLDGLAPQIDALARTR